MALLLAAASSRAQDPTFTASVDRNPVPLGEQFTFSLTLSNAGMGGGKNLRLPDLSKFHIMSGPNQSSSMQFINGVVSSTVSYSYVLQPKETGTAVIGPASIEAGGRTLRSEPITMETVKGQPRQAQQPRRGADPGARIGDNLFLRATVDRDRVMQGEQVNLTFRLYTRVSVANYAIHKNPALTGFWGEDLENPKNISLTDETIDGKQYRVGVIRRMALFPTQSGALEVSPMEIQATVQVQTRRSLDPFDAFFRDPFGETVNTTIASNAVRVRVDPLPPGAPPSFRGAVGRFSMTADVDRRSVATNEPVSLKITISGTGNVKLLEAPAVELPVDFEQYSPKISENVKRTGERISGSKTVEYLLIPRYPGKKTIKPLVFSYFDPGKKEYVTLASSPIELSVAQGAAVAAPLIAGGAREGVQMLSQDIRFIRLEPSDLAQAGGRLYRSPAFLVLAFLPAAFFAGAVVYARRRTAIMKDEAGYRRRRALRVARKGLAQAEQMLRAPSSGGTALAFYSEISRAVWRYLGDRLGIPPAEMSIDGVVAGLARRGAGEETATGLRSLLETCERARFAPRSLEVPAMQETFAAAQKVIVDVEQSLKSA